MQAFNSQHAGQQIDTAIGKANLLDTVQAVAETVPFGVPADVQIEVQPDGYIHKFYIPAGQAGLPGPAGDDTFQQLVYLGYKGTEQQMLDTLLLILQPI